MTRKAYTTRAMAPAEVYAMSDFEVECAKTVVVGNVSCSQVTGTGIEGVRVDVRLQGDNYSSVRICPRYVFPNRIAAKRFTMMMGYVQLFEYVAEAA